MITDPGQMSWVRGLSVATIAAVSSGVKLFRENAPPKPPCGGGLERALLALLRRFSKCLSELCFGCSSYPSIINESIHELVSSHMEQS